MKTDKQYIISILQREIDRYKKNNNNKHSHQSRIDILKKVIDYVEKEC